MHLVPLSSLSIAYVELPMKMPQRSRQLLLSDAEKLYAAQQLWLSYSERASCVLIFAMNAKYLIQAIPSRPGIPHELLYEVVKAYMSDHDDGYHDDLLRAFFRSRVST